MNRKSYLIKKMVLILYFYFFIEINLFENNDFNVMMLFLKFNKNKINDM